MVFSGLFFGWTIGSHYTGATMGMAYGSGARKSTITATVLIGIFVLLGATFESHNIIKTVGTGIIWGEDMPPFGAMCMMLTAALVTAANTWMKCPVSTSQLACFSVVGSALAMGAPVFWGTTIVFLFVTWIGTPILSCILGFMFTRLTTFCTKDCSERVNKWLGYGVLAACCYAAYTLGANTTGNAVGVFFGLKLTTLMKAGFIGGIVMAIGAPTWGRPILEKAGKGIVTLGLSMGVGVKMAQSITAHTAVFLGCPTSMNQVLIGGVAEAGGARGLKTLDLKAPREIVISWFFTPILAEVISFLLYTPLSCVLKVQ
jgi:phosphate/sulfate permease